MCENLATLVEINEVMIVREMSLACLEPVPPALIYDTINSSNHRPTSNVDRLRF